MYTYHQPSTTTRQYDTIETSSLVPVPS